jgi:outer membrane protein TolC
LTAYSKEQFRQDTLSRASSAAQRAVILAKEQYKAGLVDFNNVLDAERSLLALEDELAQSNGATVSNLVRLYKAFGGGWTKQADEEETD